MYHKYLLAAAIVASFTAPALAAAPGLWYVAQEAGTRECWVTTRQPNAKTVVMVGLGGYSTQAKAIEAMQHTPKCHPGTKLWYVAQEARTRGCWVTTKQPDAKTVFMVGLGGYSNYAKAIEAMQHSPKCESRAGGH